MVKYWWPWLSLNSKKYEASIKVRCLKWATETEGDHDHSLSSPSRLTVEIRWKGSKGYGFLDLRKKVKRNCTGEGEVDQNGVVWWDEEFSNVCRFSGRDKEGCFSPWEVAFFILNASDRGQKNKLVVAGPEVLNLAKFDSVDTEQELEISFPLSSVKCSPTLCLTLLLREPRTNQKTPKAIRRSLTMPLSAPLSPCFGIPATLDEEDESPTLNRGLIKAKSMNEYVSSSRGKSKKAYQVGPVSDGKLSTGSENSEDNCSFNTYSLDHNEEGLLEDNSLGYGNLITANLAGQMFDLRRSRDDEGLVYYSNREPEADLIYTDDVPSKTPERTFKLSPRLQKMKRKLSLKSDKVKGEPFLKKEYEERGGDDLDIIRWQLCFSDDSTIMGCKAEESHINSDFGDDSFAVGRWESIEVVSRDGLLKLQTQVFFATFDQRSKKADGGSACASLSIVVAHWLHSNNGQMPIQSDFERLIIEGSLHWRELCKNKSIMDQFPNKHLDLETVLKANLCPISVETSTGFFHSEGIKNENISGDLDEFGSFERVWDEISTSTASNAVYIVSWNDHFFVLKVEAESYYVIDTLGERLHEGCSRAYMLKFDKDTTIWRVSNKEDSEDGEEEKVVCRGKEACKEYIKSFLAEIRIRQWGADQCIEGKRKRSKPLHELLQIDVHCTRISSTLIDTNRTDSGEADAA